MTTRQRKLLLFTCILCAVLLAGLFLPTTSRRYRQSMVSCHSLTCYALPLTGGDTLYLPTDTASGQPFPAAWSPTKVLHHQRTMGCFVSASGRLLTPSHDLPGAPDTLHTEALRPRLQWLCRHIAQEAQHMAHIAEEMAYYERTHSVDDEGFHRVMAHADSLHTYQLLLERTQAVADSLLQATAPIRATLRRTCYICHSAHPDSAARRIACRRLTTQGNDIEVWQTVGQCLPAQASSLRLSPLPYTWLHTRHYRYRAWSAWGYQQPQHHDDSLRISSIPLVAHQPDKAFPLTGGAEGAVLCDGMGWLCGMWMQGASCPSYRLYINQWGTTGWIRSQVQDLRAYVNQLLRRNEP